MYGVVHECSEKNIGESSADVLPFHPPAFRLSNVMIRGYLSAWRKSIAEVAIKSTLYQGIFDNRQVDPKNNKSVFSNHLKVIYISIS